MDSDESRCFPLSAITHYAFCQRRCALVHVEKIWSDNWFTVKGNELHRHVDAGMSESRGEHRRVRSLRIFSKRLGLSGTADVVEFERDDENGVYVLPWKGKWMPVPVEYKLGTAKNKHPYMLQLCAQAMCIEEIFKVNVVKGVIYNGSEKRRETVSIDGNLRAETEFVCENVRKLLCSGVVPPANNGPMCRSCSLIDVCLPSASRRSAKEWIKSMITGEIK